MTYLRIGGANVDDLRALHGIARLRHGYTQIAPIVAPYFTTATHDDMPSVLTAYGPGPSGGIGFVVAGLTSSGGMIGLITSMVGGVLAAVVALAIGVDGSLALWVGIGGSAVVFVLLLVSTLAQVSQGQTTMTARFPAPETESPSAVSSVAD